MENQDRTLEEMLQEIEELLGRMQTKETTLEASFTMYEQGVRLLHSCNEKIDAVEKKMLVLNGNEQA